MRTFDFSLFGDSFSVVVPMRAPRWQIAMCPSAGSVFWSDLATERHRLQATATQANVCYDDDGEVSYSDDDYAVFDKIKAYDYQD